MTMRDQTALTSQQLLNKMTKQLGTNTGDLLILLQEISDDILQFLSMGVPVTIAGIGTFRTSDRGDGSLQLEYQPDSMIQAQLS